MRDWKIFSGRDEPHDGLRNLPLPPPWRLAGTARPVEAPPADLDLGAEAARAEAFQPTDPMIIAVNAALYLRRPLLLTGQPGTGKSTLIAKVAHELKMGPVLRWPISSRSTVRAGIYEYDAVGRLQAGKDAEPPVEQYLTLGPLGTALLGETWPRALLIDEIDKSDLDFANDLLNVIEEGRYEIPELRRLGQAESEVRDAWNQSVKIVRGEIQCRQFPFVVMTSNGEREFPGPFLRRCVRLTIKPPEQEELTRIVYAHLERFLPAERRDKVEKMVGEFVADRQEKELSTDQLLNAVFLTVGKLDTQERTFGKDELLELRSALMQQLSGAGE